MLWCFVAILSGFFASLADTFCKIYIQRSKFGHSQGNQNDPLFLSFIRWAWSIPALLPFLAISWDISFFNHDLMRTLLILAPLEITATLFYMGAIKASQVSLVLPFQSLTPMLTPLTGFLILAENFRIEGLLGVFTVAIGGYIMNAHEKGLLAPIKATFKDRGVIFMCVTATIYALTSVLGRKLTILTSPEFFGSFYITLLTIVLIPLILARHGSKGFAMALGSKDIKIKIGIGLAMSVMVILHFIAIKSLQTAYMVSLKRTSAIFAVALGRVILGEGHFKNRLLGASVMFAGVTLVSISV
jgi:uncharacterized membrane protein